MHPISKELVLKPFFTLLTSVILQTYVDTFCQGIELKPCVSETLSTPVSECHRNYKASTDDNIPNVQYNITAYIMDIPVILLSAS